MMNKRTNPSPDDVKVDAEALKLADEALRRLLTSPPAPFTPKPKKAKKK
jgi:hypothetical protein